jgi:F0F1-type ATP synthase assembly protein I
MFGGINRKEVARAMALSQVGLMMAVPPGLGAWLDYYFGWSPWGVVVGAVLGLTTGLIQLVRLSNRENDPKPGQADDTKTK